MEIDLNLEEYTNLLRTAAQEALGKSSVGRKTGSLLNSISVKTEGTGEDIKYVLSFNDYGLFLDEGVAGTISGKTAAGFLGKSFNFTGAFKMTGGSLPYGARTSIYKFGLKPRPWVASAIAAIEEAAVVGIERDLPKEIEDKIVRTINSVGTININV